VNQNHATGPKGSPDNSRISAYQPRNIISPPPPLHFLTRFQWKSNSMKKSKTKYFCSVDNSFSHINELI